MTNAQKAQAIKELVASRPTVRSKEEALARLIAEGILNKSGSLAAAYGGAKKTVKAG